MDFDLEQLDFSALSDSDQGDPEIQYKIGCCLLYGAGGAEQNEELALEYLQAAADQGYAPAAALLESLDADADAPEEALSEETLPAWCLRAEEGDAEAQYQVAAFFLQSDHGKVDKEVYDRDVSLLLEAAKEGGNGKACYELAMRKQATGDADDEKEAIELLGMAAECGILDAQWRLAECYSAGIGVPQDTAEAERWFVAAAGNPDADAEKKYSLAKRFLTGDGVSQKQIVHCFTWLRRAEEAGMVDAKERLKKECPEESLF